MSEITLKNLLVPSKEVDVEYPGLDGFTITLCFLSRESINDMRKKSTRTVYKKHQETQKFDDDMFLELYVRGTVKNWSGLTLKNLAKLAPIDTKDLDLSTEIPYSEETALELIRNSTEFDKFVSDFTSDLENFSQNS